MDNPETQTEEENTARSMIRVALCLLVEDERERTREDLVALCTAEVDEALYEPEYVVKDPREVAA